MATTTNIRVDTQLTKAKLQARLDAHKKAFDKFTVDTDKYKADLVKWAQKAIKTKDVKVEVNGYHYISIKVTDEMRDGMPKEPQEKDYPGLLSSYRGYIVAELEEALAILDITVDPAIYIKSIGNVARFLN